MTSFGALDDNTLDEPVWETLKRDVITIGRNLRSVLIPVNWDFENTGALHNWDLWGPLVSAGTPRCTPRGWWGVVPRTRPPAEGACRPQEPAPPGGRLAGSTPGSCLPCPRGQGRGPTRLPTRARPQVFMLVLAITLSAGEKKPSDVFAVRAPGGRACAPLGRGGQHPAPLALAAAAGGSAAPR
jgi:hypothetical protein